jgi:DNA-binding transcriptional MerR regulator
MPHARLTVEELAARWRLKPKTLHNWHLIGKGPTPVKVGRRLLYRAEDVEAWEDAQREQGSRARSA